MSMPMTKISSSKINPSTKSTGSMGSTNAAIGGPKESTNKNRNVTTSVNLFGRSGDSFSTSAGKGKNQVSTTGGM